MIRHIIAAIATLLALWAMYFMYQLDVKAERFKQIQEVIRKSHQEVHLKQTVQPIQKAPTTTASQEAKKKENEAEQKLKALKERAGNMMAFKVSPLYKQKCSSCHGVNGEGIIGPKLVGKNESEVYQALVDFKSGKRKNYVMYGLLTKMSDDEIKALSKEIGTFAQKMEAASK